MQDKNTIYHKYLYCSCLIASTGAAAFLCSALGGQALAQDSQPADLVAQADSGKIEEVIVTARKKSENAQKVPISIQVLNGNFIATYNIVSAEDLAVYTPDMRFNNGTISPYRVVRGVGSSSNLSFQPAVGQYDDQVYTGRPELSRTPLFDLERVEVLRGPQVILFGNSTTAGAISITTRKPSHEFEADGRVSYEARNQETVVQGGVSVPITDWFSVRVAGINSTLDKGWERNIVDGATFTAPLTHDQAFRVSAVLDPTDSLSISLKYQNAQTYERGNLPEIIANYLHNPLVVDCCFNHTSHLGQGAPIGIGNNLGIPGDASWINSRSNIAQGDIVYTVGDLSITSTTAFVDLHFFQQYEPDSSPLPLDNYIWWEDYRQFSQEIRASDKIGALDFTAGAYFQDDHDYGRRHEDLNLPAFGLPLPAVGVRSDYHAATKDWSLFVDTVYHLTEKLRIGAGVRYTNTDKTVDQRMGADLFAQSGVNTLDYNPVPGGLAYSIVAGVPHDFQNVKLSEHHVQPQAVLQYDIAPNIMTFAKFVHGAKAGGYDWVYTDAGNAGANGGIFRPETASSYEVGAKGQFLDDHLTGALTLFREDFSNLQVSQWNGSSFFVSNAAGALSQGAELEATWRATPELTMTTNLVYVDAHYTDYRNSTCSFEERQAAGFPSVCVQDLSGEPLIYASKYQGSLGLDYAHQVGFYLIEPRVDFNFRSSYQAGGTNSPTTLQKSYVLVDARLELSPEDGRWTLSLFSKNLTDKHYYEYASETALLNGVFVATTNRGAQYGLQLGVKF